MSDTPAPQMYVLICLEVSEDKEFGTQYSIEPLGVFDDLDQAIIYATKLDSLDKTDGNRQSTYDVLEFELNDKPHILTYLEQRNRKLEDSITSVLISLMKKGYVDQLVGEDGMFYYELTKQGEKIKEDMPKLVKKLFRKRKGRDDQ